MRPKKGSLEWYVDFLMASEHQFFPEQEPSKVAPAEMAHDAVSRWLANTELTPKISFDKKHQLLSVCNQAPSSSMTLCAL